MTTQYNRDEMKLANEIATALNDQHSLPLHLQFVRRYTENFLRNKLEQVLAMPKHKIKRSRAALYVHLVTKDDEKGADREARDEAEDQDYRCPTCGQEYV